MTNAKWLFVESTVASFKEQLNKLLNDVEQERLLITIDKQPSEEELQWLTDQLQGLHIGKLTLSVNADLLTSQAFDDFIQRIPRDVLRYLELVFQPEETNQPDKAEQITRYLTDSLADQVDFPIVVSEFDPKDGWYRRCRGNYNRQSLHLDVFEKKIIERIQARSAHLAPTAIRSQVARDEYDDPALPRIRLKSLITSPTNTQEYQGLSIEVQHTEETETEIAIEEDVEIAVDKQLQDEYTGRLIAYEQFYLFETSKQTNKYFRYSDDQYSLAEYRTQFELFANLPHAIKYLSPAAAEEYRRYVPQFPSFNLNNLPSGFLLKKTKIGEYVLDFDASYERTPNAFTPYDNLLYDEVEPLYYDLTKNKMIPAPPFSTIQTWLAPEYSKDDKYGLCAKIQADYPSKFTHLWIRYGEEGLKRFIQQLKQLHDLDLYRTDFSSALYDNYLSHFKHLDHFMEEDRFARCIERIRHYDTTQRDFLKRLLLVTNDSLHDLTNTLNALDVFWRDIDKLWRFKAEDILVGQSLENLKAHQFNLQLQDGKLRCEFLDPNGYSTYTDRDGVKIRFTETTIPYDTQHHLKHPFTIEQLQPFMPDILKHLSRLGITDFGNYRTNTTPVVILERLQTILKNARNINEQIQYLPKVHIGAYQDYYASQFEDFKVLHHDMDFEYQPDGCDLYEFEQIPSDCSYYKNSFILTQNRTTLYYVDANAQRSLINDDLTALNQELSELNIFGRKHEFGGKLDRYNKRTHLSNFLIRTRLNFTPPPLPFNPTQQLYRVNFSELFSLAIVDEIADPGTFYLYVHRFMGQQASGIEYEQFRQQMELFFPFKTEASRLPRHMRMVFASLFFITHERYDPAHSLKPLLESLLAIHDHSPAHPEQQSDVFKLLCESLMRLYRSGIKLNNVEGELICKVIHAAREEKSTPIENTVKRLLTHLENNQYATLRWLAVRHKNNIPAKHALTHALDLYDLLTQHPLIATIYQEDLLVFAELISLQGITSKQQEDVKTLLSNAASAATPNNLQLAFQLTIQAAAPINATNFLLAASEIESLTTFDVQRVKAILTNYQIKASAVLVPDVFPKDNAHVRQMMAVLLIVMKRVPQQGLVESVSLDFSHEEQTQIAALNTQEIPALQVQLEQQLSTLSFILSPLATRLLHNLLATVKDAELQTAFGTKISKPFIAVIAQLPQFKTPDNFNDLLKIKHEALKLANLFDKLANESAETQLSWQNLLQKHIAKFDAVSFYTLMSFIRDLPASEALGILTLLCEQKQQMKDEHFNLLVEQTQAVSEQQFLLLYIAQYVRLHQQTVPDEDFKITLIKRYKHDPHDAILKLILSDGSNITLMQAKKLLHLTAQCDNKPQINQLCAALSPEILNALLTALDVADGDKILALLAKSHSTHLPTQPALTLEQWQKLTTALQQLQPKNFKQLENVYQLTTPNTLCLLNAFQSRKANSNFTEFLTSFEKAPFGPREDQQQFDRSPVERVINQSCDLSNLGTPYTFQRRKELMEAFLLINAMGQSLPVFNSKPAKELTNAEIQTLFLSIKNGTFSSHLTPLQTKLFALTLLREAMYRSTGQFPYSTQIIAILDSLWHNGHVFSNIDTGQGKSLIDTMKAALLWLDSDRVDVSTSSIIDAKRDIANYSPFLNFLAIPYAKSPITSASEFNEFQSQGINFSTFAQLSLFFAKAKVYDHPVEKSTDKVSFIVNESDFSLLDDRTIYRFASAEGSTIGTKENWVYNAINEFVVQDEEFIRAQTSQNRDIRRLKQYLRQYAKTHQKSANIIGKLEYDQLLQWLESALLVNYKLKENTDYIIPEDQEKVIILGKTCLSHVVKLLLTEADLKTKVSPDSKFGKGVQQLLYASLNRKYPEKNFVIEPETTTILSSTNKNLMDYYRSKQGLIWGSSGTVGSEAEILEQQQKYNIEFSRIEPHHQKQVKVHPPVFFDNETAQFNALIQQLAKIKPNPKAPPHVIFCKNIDTAKILHEKLKLAMKSADNLQLYTGHGHEESIIRNAAEGGMITITTAAIGRNTDILYNKSVGMHVWHTRVNSLRIQEQGSGRTGRQGSAGEVHFLFNRAEMKGKDQKKIQQEIDTWSLHEREFNEELYSVLGMLLAMIEQIPEAAFQLTDTLLDKEKQALNKKAEFIRTSWSTFSEECEKEYRRLRMNKTYKLEEFVHSTTDRLKPILTAAAKDIPLIEDATIVKAMNHRHQQAPAYSPYQTPVKLTDCVPAIELAYHLTNSTSNITGVVDTKAITQRVNQLLTKSATSDSLKHHEQYLQYLTTTPATQAEIRKIHQDCLAQFLTKKMQTQHWTKRWMGYELDLNQIADHQNYLLLFSAFTSLPQQTKTETLIELNLIKQSVTALLDEYRYRSWWYINFDRKRYTANLLKAVNEAQNMNTLVNVLSTHQVALAKADIKQNKKHLLKSLHYQGQSRLQTTLTRALNLVVALSPEAHANSITELNQQLESTLTGKPASAQKKTLSLDAFKLKSTLSNSTKNTNTQVITNLLNVTFARQRFGLYKSANVETSTPFLEPSMPVDPHWSFLINFMAHPATRAVCAVILLAGIAAAVIALGVVSTNASYAAIAIATSSFVHLTPLELGLVSGSAALGGIGLTFSGIFASHEKSVDESTNNEQSKPNKNGS